MPLVASNPPIPVVQRNDLARLQLEIARRADQLAPRVDCDHATDLALWEQAEQEVFARHGSNPPNVTGV